MICIPVLLIFQQYIYKTVASGSASTSIQAESKVLFTADYRFQNSTNTASVSNIYDLVRVTAKATRDIAKSIGDLVKGIGGNSCYYDLAGDRYLGWSSIKISLPGKQLFPVVKNWKYGGITAFHHILTIKPLK